MTKGIDRPTHNHLTRDIKPLGECPSCDEHYVAERGLDERNLYQMAADCYLKYTLGDPLTDEEVAAAVKVIPRLVASLRPFGLMFKLTVAELSNFGLAMESANKFRKGRT